MVTESTFKPTLVEVKAEYADIFQSLMPIELEVWSEEEPRLYEGQVVSVDEGRMILSFAAAEN